MTAFRADRVRQAHGAAIRAGYQIARLNGVMGASAVAAAFGVFTLWMWGHSVLLVTCNRRVGPGAVSRRTGGIIVAEASDVKPEPL